MRIALFIVGTIFFALLIVVIAVVTMDGRDNERAATTASNADSDSLPAMATVDVTADQLYLEYHANEVRADREFKGKTLRVTGAVKSIGKDIFDLPYLALWSPNEFADVHAQFARNADQALARVERGDRVLVRCRGAGTTLGDPILDRCLLLDLRRK